MKHFLPAALVGLLFLGGSAAAQNSSAALFDGFDGGVNQAGWQYNPADKILKSGGNPGAWLSQPLADTFAPIFRSSYGVITGDLRAKGVSAIAFDAILNDMDFGNGNGINMSILLRDTKGTPGFADDDYAYFVGPNIPLKGAGWKSFNFSIPSQSTTPVPSGWKGGWAGDGENFRPGIDWNDVITSVDQIEIQWINPAFFAIFQQWNVGMDGIAIFADGVANQRNGAGGNPLGFVSTSTPTIGSTWTSTVDIASPGHTLSLVAVSLGGPISGSFPGAGIVGELLVDQNLLTVDVQVGNHGFPIPNAPSLMGLSLSTQGATFDNGLIYLNNAIDITVGG